MAAPTTSTLAAEDENNWAPDLPSEVWALVAKHRGIVGARQLMRVCKDAHAGGLECLSTLPGLVVCGGVTSVQGGGRTGGERVSDVRRLDLATMRWEPMPALVTARHYHACCVVRGALVVLGGVKQGGVKTSRVEMLSSSKEGGAFVDLPPLSCGAIFCAAAVAVAESDSAAGQVLLVGGIPEGGRTLWTVQLVDLATGACAQQPGLLQRRVYSAVGRLADGRIVCAGSTDDELTSEVWGAPQQGAAELPAMSAHRIGCFGCVMSDGRFAVLGGVMDDGGEMDGVTTSSCEALALDDGVAHW